MITQKELKQQDPAKSLENEHKELFASKYYKVICKRTQLQPLFFSPSLHSLFFFFSFFGFFFIFMEVTFYLVFNPINHFFNFQTFNFITIHVKLEHYWDVFGM
ncbi:unnamed protein product [Citrullus colocynthis]|uniref:Uncharacterized protein n=1 Tax=Citrullus colocynthis TaxID=252529 RepID=A0ABP0YM48_9ROSI